MSHPSFVGIREIDREILLEMDDQSLDRACYVDKWTQSICTDPLFWREKILRKYGLEILQHKPLGETYYQQYQRLRRIKYDQDQYYSSIRNHHLDEMILLSRQRIPLGNEMMIYAAGKGNVEILNWLFTQGYRPNMRSLYNAIQHDSPENFEWVHQHGVPFRQDVANYAAAYGKTKMLDYLFQHYDLLPRPTQDLLNSIAGNGDLETLIWLDQQNLGLPDQQTANLIRTIIHYIKNEGPLTPEERDFINIHVRPQKFSEERIRRGKPLSLAWDHIKRLLTPEEINEILNRYENVLAWMRSRDLH